tara:strand:+ start:187 stop:513 length:327 start_codon:yes stop_codon:yes gene_type:complete
MKKKLKKDNLKNITYLEDLYEIIKKRDKEKIKKSYTKQLLRKGSNTIAQKVAEESTELIIDYLDGSKKRTIEEASDLIYHIFVLLYSKKIEIKDIQKELNKRHNVRSK